MEVFPLINQLVECQPPRRFRLFCLARIVADPHGPKGVGCGLPSLTQLDHASIADREADWLRLTFNTATYGVGFLAVRANSQYQSRHDRVKNLDPARIWCPQLFDCRRGQLLPHSLARSQIRWRNI